MTATLITTCACGAAVTSDDVLDPAYECRNGHYFTRPEADDSNLCPECSTRGRRIGTACPECRELLEVQS